MLKTRQRNNLSYFALTCFDHLKNPYSLLIQYHYSSWKHSHTDHLHVFLLVYVFHAPLKHKQIAHIKRSDDLKIWCTWWLMRPKTKSTFSHRAGKIILTLSIIFLVVKHLGTRQAHVFVPFCLQPHTVMVFTQLIINLELCNQAKLHRNFDWFLLMIYQRTDR